MNFRISEINASVIVVEVVVAAAAVTEKSIQTDQLDGDTKMRSGSEMCPRRWDTLWYSAAGPNPRLGEKQGSETDRIQWV